MAFRATSHFIQEYTWTADMTILNKISAISSLAGFKNYAHETGNGTIPTQSVAAGSYASTSISIPLNNANAVSTAKITYSVEAFTWQLTGFVSSGYLIGGEYTLSAISYYSGGNFVVGIYAANQTGGTITLPTITAEVEARLYKAPFNIA